MSTRGYTVKMTKINLRSTLKAILAVLLRNAAAPTKTYQYKCSWLLIYILSLPTQAAAELPPRKFQSEAQWMINHMKRWSKIRTTNRSQLNQISMFVHFNL